MRNKFSKFAAVLVGTTLMLTGALPIAHAASAPPTIISYQGRLTDNGGTLLGGAGTNYYFKFSIWDSATVGSGSKLWPSGSPGTNTVNVKQGVFSVNIGDTANGYPDALNYNFSSASALYLQVEVSSDNVTFETLSPRQQLTSAVYAQLAAAVVGTTTPSAFGTTTPDTNAFVTIAATSSNSIPLSIVGASSQTANLFQVKNNLLQNLFTISSTGLVTLSYASSTALTATSLFATNAQIFGSSTIGNGAQTGGLTISGGATTTGSAYFAGSVGIGTNAPSSVLDVLASGGKDVEVGGGGTTGSEIKFTYGGVHHFSIYNKGDSNLTFAQTDASFATNAAGNALMVLTNTGNLGIGTTSPFAILSVAGSGFFNGNLTGANITATGTLKVTGATTLASTLTGILHAASGVVSAAAVTLTSDISGILPVANGGTNANSQTTNGVTYYDGTKITSGTSLTFDGVTLGAPTLNTASTGAYQQGGTRILYASSTTGSLQIGQSAGNTTNVNATFNTLVGYNAGANITSGSNNIMLGAWSTSANANVTSGSNNIQIGYNIKLPSATANNQLDIGNLLYGANVDGSVNSPSTGQFGIGSTTPYARLSIQANAGDTNTTLFAVGSSTASATTTLFSVNNAGLVTATSLAVTGATTLATSLTGVLHAASGVVSAAAVSLTADVSGILGISNGGTGTSTQVTNGVNYYDGSKITSGTALTFDGTTLGLSKLTVNGGLVTYSAANATSTIKNNSSFAWTLATSTTASPLFRIDTNTGSEQVVIGTPSSDVIIGDVGQGANLVFEENSTIKGQGTGRTLTIGANNDVVNFGVKVGIGTTTPYAKLTVWGSSAGSVSTSNGTTTINTATTSSTFTVPSGVTSITVKAWGAGGGGGVGSNTAAQKTGGGGGGGGFAQGTIAVTPGEILTINVGSGGGKGIASTDGGGGGGYTDVERSSSPLILAAGGGGGGGSVSTTNSGGDGGGGGGTTGNTGANSSGNFGHGGAGGTSSAGGAGGTSGTGVDGVAGTSLTGGTGGAGADANGGSPGGGNASNSANGGGGGGGGGYFGGGGGEDGANTTTQAGGGGGGGGSSVTSGSNTTNTAGSTGSSGAGGAAANASDFAYSGSAGLGGAGNVLLASAAAGNPGLMVITYTTTATSSTGRLFEVVNSASTTVFSVSDTGVLQIVKLSAVRVFTASGNTQNWSVPQNLSYAIVETWGSGGGGGGSTAGSAGGTTNFDGLATSTGGSGGTVRTVNGGIGGAGGSGSGGDINLTGQGGSPGTTYDTTDAVGGRGGPGGNAPRGGGGGATGNPGNPGASFGGGGAGQSGGVNGGGGGGGGGGYTQNTFQAKVFGTATSTPITIGVGGAGGNAGGNGADGGVVIYEYTTSMGGNDLAEEYPTDDPSLGAGDIVSFDFAHPAFVKKADASEDAPLAGVISTAPGQVLGLTDKPADALGDRPVALSGRVPVKVNLEGGPIAAGDRIALSSVPGVGKKASLFESSVGIAMEPASEEGTVLLFINLQEGVNLTAISSGLLGLPLPDIASTTATSTATSTPPADFVDSLLSVITGRLSATSSASAADASSTPAISNFAGALFGAFMQMLQGLGVFVSDSMTRIEHLFADHLTVGSSAEPAGVTLFDQDTGAPYCVVVRSGALVPTAGACDSAAPWDPSQDSSGSSTPALDTTPPSITLSGENPTELDVGASYVDLGATVTDDTDQNLSPSVSVDGGATTTVGEISLDTSVAGTHYILFSATDQAGNTGTAMREVIVGEEATSTEP